jgi:hypothetical protein
MKKVIFRDYQEEVADDHNNLQDYIYEQLDDVTSDTVSTGRRYAGMLVQKTGQVEVTVGVGRIYDGGLVYKRRTSFTQSMSQYTTAAAKRIVAITAYGNENFTDENERDFLVDVDNNTVEPQQVSMSTSRDVQLVFTAGAEAADPQPPPVPATHVLIAYVVMDTTQVISVTMLVDNQVVSTDSLATRAKALETFKSQIEPRVGSLGADLADLANQLRSFASPETLARVYLDVARLKSALKFPTNSSGYGSFPYLDLSYSDTTNAAQLGYDARVEEGIRFPVANADKKAINIFAANDPNAKITSGILLPAYTEELKLQTGDFYSELGIAQYGFQTLTTKTGYMSRSRIRYGGSQTVCTNGTWWGTTGQPMPEAGLYEPESVPIQFQDDVSKYYHGVNAGLGEVIRTDTYWFDTWQEPFNYTVTVDNTITGAQVAQTLLVSNDMWATKLGFYITAKGANEDIKLMVTEVTNGQPDLSKVMMNATYPQASIVAGWNYVPIKPTFFQKGKRLAIVLVSNANHKIGMTSGQSYVDGTFFYSTDSIYYQGDLTKDMMLQVFGAKFAASQVTIPFAALNLDGGIRDLDIIAEMWVPSSTQLIFEIRPNGSGEWLAITDNDVTNLAGAPPLCEFRGRFIGTKDMMPALNLNAATVKMSRPKTAFKHVSLVEVVPSTSSITVKVLLERFNDLPHDYDLSLYITAGPSGTLPRMETADSVVTKLIDANAGRYERTFVFNLDAPATGLRFVQTGQTNSPTSTYHVAELDYYVV